MERFSLDNPSKHRSSLNKGQLSPQTSERYQQMAVSFSKLGPQCIFETQQAAEKSYVDLSDELFDQSIAFMGFQESDLQTMYDAKKLKTSELCFMDKKEITSLMMYSMDVYHKLNAALREQSLENIEPFKIYMKVLNSALDKLKNFEGYVKRGATTDIKKYDDHQVGNTVEYPAYTSSSVGKGFPGNVRSLIQSKNCKYIAPFSVVPEEEEVLCKSGTQFKIIYRKENPKVLNLILEEVIQPIL